MRRLSFPFGTLIFILFVVFAVGCGQKQQPVPLSKPQLTVDERALIDSYVAGLDLLAAKSPTADSLRQFYRNAGKLARPSSDGQVQVIESPQSPIYFFVTPNVITKDFNRADNSMIGAAYKDRIVRLYSNRFSPLIRGLLLAHELVHAEDEVLRGEPRSEPLSDLWLIGEGHAHTVVYQMLNEYTGGGWKSKVYEGAHVWRKYALSHGHTASAMTLSAGDADSVRIAALFMPRVFSRQDISVLLTQYLVDANIVNFQELAGTDSTTLDAWAGEFLHEFYSSYQSTITEVLAR